MNMPILPQFGNSEQSMTSLEIAELCQKRHDNVKRTIESLVNANIISNPQIEDGIKSANGVIPKVYVFTGEKGKRDSIIVVAQLCPEFTARLVDRWAELEGKNRELTKMEILQMALESEQQKLVLQQQLEIQAPKVAFVDKYVAGNGNKTFRQVAKLLQIKEYKFREFLESNRIMYKLNGEWTAYQNHVDAKRFHVKTGVSDSGHAFNHALFTPKGIEWIAGELAKFNLRGVA
ncbi:phage antirepressor KilAC domain-containing protein [Acinetobacter towneri]|uniref:phage antirepressor KilAC domain-containing protein n=1 Tax=Acinetobacter towneri TaxID=202956 RepID=UPI0029357445|nr:phage antirepressor KilAC domain-containing protein [Acinetobacter towneri]MDV2454027.1 phage antirepressor KilAC domain-containing protein [Acinetobacter towneri]